MRLNNLAALGRRIFVTCVLGFAGVATASEQPPTLTIGSAMPAFSLPGIDGKTYTDQSFKDAKLLVLLFTCAHCPTAQNYQERIKKLVTDYQAKGVTLVAINPNHADAVRLDEMAYTDLGDSFEDMKERAKDQKFNFIWLDDGPKQEVAHKIGPVATPHVFIFDEDRKLRFEGRIDDSEREATATKHETRDAIEALLAGKQPAVTSTKVFGCSVKWADKVPDNINAQKKWAAEPVALEKANAAVLKAIRENKDSGKIRFINVWATWCGPCITEFDELVEHNVRFRIRNFEMVTIAAEFPDQEAKARDFLTKKHASMKNYIYASNSNDEMSEAVDPAWKGALPYTIIVDEKGNVIYREMGSIDFLKMRRAIVPALNRLAPWQGQGP